jgi:hypothetical protein
VRPARWASSVFEIAMSVARSAALAAGVHQSRSAWLMNSGPLSQRIQCRCAAAALDDLLERVHGLVGSNPARGESGERFASRHSRCARVEAQPSRGKNACTRRWP